MDRAYEVEPDWTHKVTVSPETAWTLGFQVVMGAVTALCVAGILFMVADKVVDTIEAARDEVSAWA